MNVSTRFKDHNIMSMETTPTFATFRKGNEKINHLEVHKDRSADLGAQITAPSSNAPFL